MPPKKHFADFFSNWTLAIMVIKDANYYTTQHDLKAITLVDQDYSTRQGQKTRAEVWNLCKRLVEHPQNEPLSEVHNREKFPLLSHVWRRVGTIKGPSASAERIFSLAGFLISGRRWNMDAETLNCIVLQHNWLERNLM